MTQYLQIKKVKNKYAVCDPFGIIVRFDTRQQAENFIKELSDSWYK